MTLYKNVFFLAVLFSTNYMFTLTSSFEVAGSPGTWQHCEKIVDRYCGDEVRSYVFKGIEGVVSLDCCIQLVEMGNDCHEAFLAANLKSPIYKANISKILERNSKVWNQCSSVVKGESPPEKCATMKYGECGHQVVQSIFHGVGEVDDTCCGYLIYREKECHDSLLQARLARGGYESNKTIILETSTKVWNRCAKITQNLPTVKDCRSKVTETCGVQVAENVLFNKGRITKVCCIQLLKIGRECHELLALADVALPQHQAHSKDILKRSSDAWIKCLEETAH